MNISKDETIAEFVLQIVCSEYVVLASYNNMECTGRRQHTTYFTVVIVGYEWRYARDTGYRGRARK